MSLTHDNSSKLYILSHLYFAPKIINPKFIKPPKKKSEITPIINDKLILKTNSILKVFLGRIKLYIECKMGIKIYPIPIIQIGKSMTKPPNPFL